MHRLIGTALVLCITLLFAAQAPAAQASQKGSYVVAPFTINGPSEFGYLGKAIPSMLASRLYWKGHFEPASDASGVGSVAGTDAARRALKASGADYLVWGDVNIAGQNAMINARVVDKAGKEWRREATSTVNDLIPSLQSVADGINAELFGRPLATSQAASGSLSRTGARPINSEMIQNETTQSQVYLNPQIRYQGRDGDRLRTQRMPFASRAMITGDFDGDGKNEVVIMSKNDLYVYRWADMLQPLAEYRLPRSQITLALNSIDLDRDRVPEIVVTSVGIDSDRTTSKDSASMLYTESDKPYSYVLSFKGGKFREIASRLPFYLNVVKMPPLYAPTLVGQRGDKNVIFSRAGVYEVMRQGGDFVFTNRIALPKSVNVFNFMWLPGNGRNDPELMISLNKHDKIRVFDKNGKELYTSAEVYSGSQCGIEESVDLPGLGSTDIITPGIYYLPMRMIAADLDQNGQWELLVNHPVSVAAQFFSSYREYPEGEIQALTWDGVGTSMLWKTRRIKGTVVDFSLCDVNNDGVLDLVVCLNTSAGTLGVNARKTTLVAYPLNLDQADPNTPPVIENR